MLWGLGARLERALASFMLDLHTREHGYTEVYPPYLGQGRGTPGHEPAAQVRRRPVQDQAQRSERSERALLDPDGRGARDEPARRRDLGSVAVAARIHRVHALLPQRSGSYGRDVRGLIRQHQFDKVEIVRFSTPEQSLAELEKLTLHAEEVLKRLNLHYRVGRALRRGSRALRPPRATISRFGCPSQNTYREISSCSVFGDFQARRAKIRYRAEAKGKPKLLHTLNGSGLAIGRTWVAILEQFQQADGSVLLPQPLHAFMGTDRLSLPES